MLNILDNKTKKQINRLKWTLVAVQSMPFIVGVGYLMLFIWPESTFVLLPENTFFCKENLMLNVLIGTLLLVPCLSVSGILYDYLPEILKGSYECGRRSEIKPKKSIKNISEKTPIDNPAINQEMATNSSSQELRTLSIILADVKKRLAGQIPVIEKVDDNNYVLVDTTNVLTGLQRYIKYLNKAAEVVEKAEAKNEALRAECDSDNADKTPDYSSLLKDSEFDDPIIRRAIEEI